MTWQVFIAHAKGEERLAEQLAEPLREAGYGVTHEGTMWVGDSIVGETEKALSSGQPLVLCGTVRAVGSKWARKLVNAAHARPGGPVFVVQMEEDADVESLALGGKVAHYYQDPAAAVRALVESLNKYYPPDADSEGPPRQYNAEKRYRDLALQSCDIIDLANLPETDRHLATRRLELRRLYVALRVRVEIRPDAVVGETDLKEIEKRRGGLRKLSALDTAKDDQQSAEANRVPIGLRLSAARRLVVLGDPGAGKTTMIRWMATSYLLRLKHNSDWKELPDVATLPDADWLPIIVRCRDLDAACLQGSLDTILSHTLRRTELSDAERASMLGLLKERLSGGQALLLLDGLDEIVDPSLRIRFCQQLEQIQTAYPDIPMVITSRIVGYKEIGYRISRGFEHLTFTDLSRQDKDDFARRWCELTETQERRASATRELIHDIHSADRIERLTGNPMLLTTLALVKRKIGSLPSRRADLYWDALEVLLNWRREVDEPIDHREAVPQLEYIAYAMCERGVAQLREDELVELLVQMREEYPQIHLIHKHSAEEFIRLLERRTGILVESGHVRYHGRPTPLFEFRHLTFQEYLAGLALVEGRFPRRDRERSLAENIARLAGQTTEVVTEENVDEEDVDDGVEAKGNEITTSENWREPIRLCVASCNDDDVDAALLAILTPLPGDAQTTARPRAVQVALCLADDPNASEGVARKIIQTFVSHVGKKDGLGAVKTSADVAVKELSGSRWAGALYGLLLKEFREGEPDLRDNFATLCGMVAVAAVPEDEAAVRQKLADLSAEINSGDEVAATGAALQVMYLCFSRRVHFHLQEIVDGLLSLLNGSRTAANAASFALYWMNYWYVKAEPWQPTEEDTGRIVAYVENPNSDVSAVQRLSYILGGERVERAVTPLIGRLDDEAEEVRAAAAAALGWLCDSRAVEPLVAKLDDGKSKVRVAACNSLGQMGDASAVEPLIARLEDEDKEVRKAAAWALGWNVDERAVGLLIARLEDDHAGVQQAAARALSRIGELSALPPLLAKLESENDDVRMAVVWSLGRLGDARALGPLTATLSDEQSKVRVTAAYALGRFEDERALAALTDALEDSDSDVRKAAAEALGEVRDARAAEALIAKLDDKVVAVRKACAEALGDIGDARAVGPLTALLDDADTGVQAEAIVALSELGDARTVTVLRRKLEDKDISVRTAAAGALGQLEHVESVELLSDNLDSENADDRNVARQATLWLALNKFEAGNVEGAAEIFKLLVSKATADDYCGDLHNNTAFCFTLLGRYEEAAEQFEAMDFSKRRSGWPLYQHNRGVLLYLMGDAGEGVRLLKESLDWIRSMATNYQGEYMRYMLVLGRDGSVTSHDRLPVDAAALMNLYVMGGMTLEAMYKELARVYRPRYESWLRRAGID